MVGHHAIGEDRPPISRLDLPDQIDEPDGLLRVREHRFAARYPIVDVIDTPLDKDPGPPRHVPRLRQLPNFFKPGTDVMAPIFLAG